MNQEQTELKGKNILVTGGAGCIGSNLTRALIEAEAAKIIILDDPHISEEEKTKTLAVAKKYFELAESYV